MTLGMLCTNNLNLFIPVDMNENDLWSYFTCHSLFCGVFFSDQCFPIIINMFTRKTCLFHTVLKVLNHFNKYVKFIFIRRTCTMCALYMWSFVLPWFVAFLWIRNARLAYQNICVVPLITISSIFFETSLIYCQLNISIAVLNGLASDLQDFPFQRVEESFRFFFSWLDNRQHTVT